jgi:hypothetical protein
LLNPYRGNATRQSENPFTSKEDGSHNIRLKQFRIGT